MKIKNCGNKSEDMKICKSYFVMQEDEYNYYIINDKGDVKKCYKKDFIIVNSYFIPKQDIKILFSNEVELILKKDVSYELITKIIISDIRYCIVKVSNNYFLLEEEKGHIVEY